MVKQFSSTDEARDLFGRPLVAGNCYWVFEEDVTGEEGILLRWTGEAFLFDTALAFAYPADQFVTRTQPE